MSLEAFGEETTHVLVTLVIGPVLEQDPRASYERPLAWPKDVEARADCGDKRRNREDSEAAELALVRRRRSQERAGDGGGREEQTSPGAQLIHRPSLVRQRSSGLLESEFNGVLPIRRHTVTLVT